MALRISSRFLRSIYRAKGPVKLRVDFFHISPNPILAESGGDLKVPGRRRGRGSVAPPPPARSDPWVEVRDEQSGGVYW